METPSLKIFLTEDDRDDRDLFAEALQVVDPRAALTQFADGMDLMQTLRSHSLPFPDFIFLDLNMPYMGGLECLRGISTFQGIPPELKTIVLSTSCNPSDIEEAYANGASFYIVKPVDFNALTSALTKVFHHDWRTPVAKPDFFIDGNPPELRKNFWYMK